MNEELVKKRLSLASVAIGLISGLLVSAVGAVAWATQFQTKTAAAVATDAAKAVINDVIKKQIDDHTVLMGLREDVTNVKETVNRVDDKVDQLLLRGRR